jgi:hypothetical protein
VVDGTYLEQFPPALVQLPNLEQLKLSYCSLHSCSCLLQLASSTKLTSLQIDSVTNFNLTKKVSSSSQLLQPLQQLVQLELLAQSLPTTATGVQHIADMHALQTLLLTVDLKDCSTSLPSSITTLVLQHHVSHRRPELPAALLQHLSNLQQLQLKYFTVSSKDCGSAQQLQQLTLSHCHVDDGDALMDMIKGLTRLQSLVIADTDIEVEDPQAFSALTTSSHLTRLQLTMWTNESPPLLPGNVKAMFVPGRGQQLRQLSISSDDSEEYCIFDEDLSHITSSCPDLHTLDLCGTVDISADLSPLTQLTACSCLALGGEAINDGAASVVAELTGLVSLSFLSCSKLTDLGLAKLTVLTQLTRLAVRRCYNISFLEDKEKRNSMWLCSSNNVSHPLHCGEIQPTVVHRPTTSKWCSMT